jgi:hypothetical protein
VAGEALAAVVTVVTSAAVPHMVKASASHSWSKARRLSVVMGSKPALFNLVTQEATERRARRRRARCDLAEAQRNEILGYGVTKLMGWRRRLVLGASVLFALGPLAVAPTVPTAAVAVPVQVLGPRGVGPVPFGTANAKAVGDLSRLFGRPSSQGANTGCGPRYSEVEWGELVAEFRSGAFSGYRYLKGGWPLTTPGSPRRPPPSQLHGPPLATAKGISLGSTLEQLRSLYGDVHFVGVDKWRAADGVVFVVDAAREPGPPPPRVVEIKFGTCGDF